MQGFACIAGAGRWQSLADCGSTTTLPFSTDPEHPYAVTIGSTTLLYLQILNIRTFIVKFLSAATAVGSGLPVGPEGPMIHMVRPWGLWVLMC